MNAGWGISPLEIHQISAWNLADFTQISTVKSTQNYKSKCFSKNSSVWWMQAVGDFTLEIHQISPVMSGRFSPRFHLWNPTQPVLKASVLAKTLQFDECRVGARTKDFMKFTLKSGGFHPWTSGRFHHPEIPQIIKASVSAKTLQFDECWVGAVYQGFDLWNPAESTLKSGGFQLWHPVDFTQIWTVTIHPKL